MMGETATVRLDIYSSTSGSPLVSYEADVKMFVRDGADGRGYMGDDRWRQCQGGSSGANSNV